MVIIFINIIIKNFLCSQIFTILPPDFYKSPGATGRYFNTVSTFEFCKASVETFGAIINIKEKKTFFVNMKYKMYKNELGYQLYKISKFVDRNHFNKYGPLKFCY